jgi:hypothetical protein
MDSRALSRESLSGSDDRLTGHDVRDAKRARAHVASDDRHDDVTIGQHANGPLAAVRHVDVDDDEVADVAVAHELRSRSQLVVRADRHYVAAAEFGYIHGEFLSSLSSAG